MGRSGNRADVTEPVRYPGKLGRYAEDDDQAFLEGRQSRDLPDEPVSYSEAFEFDEDAITEVDLPIGEQATRPLPKALQQLVAQAELPVVPYKPPPVPSPLPLTRTEGPRYTGSSLARRPQAQQNPPPFRGYVPSTRPPPPLEPSESPGHEWVGAVVVVASLTGLVLLAMVAGVVAAGWMG
jgi:hypothetical protein